MTDRLTQIQDCVDQLATQLFASFYYTTNFSSPAPIEGQPFQPGSRNEDNKEKEASDTQNSTVPDSQQPPPEPKPLPKPSREEFASTLQELAVDLVVKEQQIEMLLGQLPGLERTQEQQEQRLRELNGEMEAVRTEWIAANERREALRERVEGVILKTWRV